MQVLKGILIALAIVILPVTANGQSDDIYNDDTDNTSSLTSRNVIAHIISNEGEPFEYEKLTITLSEDDQKKLADKSEEIAKWSTEQILETNILPNCTKNETIRTHVSIGGGKLPADTLLSDILFLRESEIPEDPVDAFGPTALIYPYDPTPNNAAARIAKGYGITCVPYRIRITDKYSDRLSGNDALKNYSRDLTGKGFTHKEIKKRAKQN